MRLTSELLLLIEFLDEFIYGAREAAWPLIRTDLSLTYTQIGVLLGLPGLVSGLLEPLIGVLGDTWRRHLLILGGGVVFALALLLTGLSHTYALLLLGFMLFNPASGAFVGLAQATLMDLAPHRRELNMARWTFAGSLGVVLGPLALGGIVALALGWRAIFIGTAGVSLVVVLVAQRNGRSSHRAPKQLTPEADSPAPSAASGVSAAASGVSAATSAAATTAPVASATAGAAAATAGAFAATAGAFAAAGSEDPAVAAPLSARVPSASPAGGDNPATSAVASGTEAVTSTAPAESGAHAFQALVTGLGDAFRALRRWDVLRWLTLLQASDLLLDVLLGYLALYLVDIAGATVSQATTGIAVWTGVGLVGDFLIIGLLKRVDGLHYLRISVAIELGLFVAFLLVPGFATKLVLLGLLGLFNAGWYAVLSAQLYDVMPGQSGTAMAVGNIFGLVGSLIPMLLGWVAQRWGLTATMWLLALGPVTLLVGLPRGATDHS